MATPVCWQLRRNCSLTPRQALLAWALPVAALLGVALGAALLGWWWVVVFAFVDLAGLLAACWRYSRHALDGETLLLGDDGMLHIERQDAQRLLRTAWPASLVRVELRAGEAITLRAGRERLEVGLQATPRARERAARELRERLGQGHPAGTRAA